MNRMGYRALVGVATALLAAVVDPAAAQTVFTACRVPVVGVLYLLNAPADPCLDAGHIKFSWTDGGAPGANTVTSAMIVDATLAAGDHGAGSVNSAAILDGTVAAADHAAGSVNSAAIVDGSVAAADLAAGLVAGVEFGSATGSIDPTGTAATALSITLSHPASGYIVTHGLAQIQCNAVNSLITVGITNGSTGTDSWSYNVPTTAYTMVASQSALQVTGAGTATINFNVVDYGDCPYFRATQLWAVYVPNRY